MILIINPWYMCEGYGSHSVYLSVTKLAATYPVCKPELRCYMVPYGVPNACIVWIPLKTLCSPVLVSFADCKLLDFSTKQHSTFYLYEGSCTGIHIRSI